MYRGGLEELNKSIEAARCALAQRDRLRSRIATAQKQEVRLEDKVELLEERLEKEQLDVKRLEGRSLKALVATILGAKEARLDKERREALAAKLKLDEAQAELEVLSTDIDAMEEERSKLEEAEERLAELIDKKQAWIQEHGGPEALELLQLSDERSPLASLHREVCEAVTSGNVAIEALSDITRLIESNDRWTPPARGGMGLLTHSDDPLEDVRPAISRAQNALIVLERELDDVDLPLHGEGEGFDFEDLTTFADVMYEDIVAELDESSESAATFSTVANAMERVFLVMRQLESRQDELEVKLDDLDHRRQAILERW